MSQDPYSQSQPSYGYQQSNTPSGYGYDQQDYGQQSTSYGYNQQDYGQQSTSYGHDQPGYGQQSTSYGYDQQTPSGYGYSQQSYGYGQPAAYGYDPYSAQPYGSAGQELAPVMKVKDWIIMTLVLMIPFVGFIMLFVWAFDKSTNPNKANYAKASLLIAASVLAIYLLILFVIVVGIVSTS